MSAKFLTLNRKGHHWLAVSTNGKGRYCIAISAEHSDAFSSLEQGISI